MKSNYYGTFNYILFGESHSEEIGIIIEGLKEGLSFDFNEIEEQLKLRQGGMIFNTPRQEKTDFEITTGYEFGKTTGEALCIVFKNNDIVKKDYDHLLVQPRPGHADYVGSIKYKDNQLGSGGSHFSGRMSTPLVAAGAIMQQVIKKDYPNLDILTHINSFQGI
ncbi:MAG: chorismate synthase, partial [Erysipelotrichales bacterium]